MKRCAGHRFLLSLPTFGAMSWQASHVSRFGWNQPGLIHRMREGDTETMSGMVTDWLFRYFGLDVLIVVVGALSGIILYLSFQKQRVLSVEVLPAPPGGRRPLKEDDSDEHSLKRLGFSYVADYNIVASKRLKYRSRAYLSPDRTCHVLFVDQGGGDLLIMLHTDFAPSGNITTDNAPLSIGAWIYPKWKLVMHVPWLETVDELLSLHTAVCEAAEEYGLAPILVGESDSAEAVKNAIVKDTRNDYEHWTKIGIMKRVKEDTYRFTLFGAVVCTWAIMYKIGHGIVGLLPFLRPGSRHFRKKLYRRLSQTGVTRSAGK